MLLQKRWVFKCMTATEYVKLILGGEKVFQCMLHDDASSPATWEAIGLVNASCLLGSPPCQPWSTAGSSHGLNSHDGKNFQCVLRQVAAMNITLSVFENVPGLPKHADFRELIHDAEKRGLKLAVQGVHSCAKVLPVQRDRWLGTFVHVGCQLDASRQVMASAISFADRAFNAVASCPTIKGSDVMHVNMSEVEKTQLNVSSELKELLSKFEYAPSWLKNRLRGLSNPTADQILNARVVVDCQQFIGFMAMYGRQHSIPDELLKSKGLQTMLVNDGTGTRLISPWEMIASMGYQHNTVLSSDIEVSWRMAGNGLSIAHAWLQLHKTHVLLGQDSPFTPAGTPTQQVAEFQNSAIRLSEWTAVIEGHFWKLVKCSEMPANKRVKVSNASVPAPCPTIACTVPFTIIDDQASGTKSLENSPEFAQMHDPRGWQSLGRTIAKAWSPCSTPRTIGSCLSILMPKT